MLFFTLNLSGTDEDASVLHDCLTEWDDCFEDDEPSSEVIVDDGDEGLYHHDDIGEVQDLAISIAEALSYSEFTIKGYIDTSESASEFMDFLITYKNNTLV